MEKSDIGTRMKYNYEQAYNIRLPLRMPVILRLDGKTFHTFTRGMQRPFDEDFMQAMIETAGTLCKQVQNCVFAYTQSDEISLLLHNYKRLDTQPWINNELQKMVSISASIAASFMSRRYNREALFDARVFVLPESEAVNYFLWRQLDASRNSVNMLAQSLFSHRELQGKSNSQMQDMMMLGKGVNWNDLPTYKKWGTCLYKDKLGWIVDVECPIFSHDRDYIQRHLVVEQ
jgi:tRNA(His) guanylyltransferase